MPIESVKQLCTPSSVVVSDSLVEQVAQIEDFAAGKVDGREFFRRNHFTDGLKLLVNRGFDRLAGRSEDGAFYLTQAMGGGKTHSLIAFGLLASGRASSGSRGSRRTDISARRRSACPNWSSNSALPGSAIGRRSRTRSAAPGRSPSRPRASAATSMRPI